MTNKMEPLVSVVMSVYNRESYIVEAVKSILDQTFSDFEFIIVDDGSTDNTWNLLKSFKDDRLRLLRNDVNIGISRSVNKAIGLASGKYVARMDSDDISLPSRLQDQVDFLVNNPDCGIVGGGWKHFGHSSFITLNELPVSQFDMHVQLFFGPCFGQPTVMFKKHLWDEFKLFYDEDLIVAEDYDLWAKMLRITHGANLNKVLVLYRSHGGNITQEKMEMLHHQTDLVRKRYLKSVYEGRYSEEELAVLSKSIGDNPSVLNSSNLKLVMEFFNELYTKLGNCSESFLPIIEQRLSNKFTSLCAISAPYVDKRTLLKATMCSFYNKNSYSRVKLFLKSFMG